MTHLYSRLTQYRPGCGQHLVKHTARGEDVSAWIDTIATCLLGCSVRCGAVWNAYLSDLRVMNAGCACCFFVEQFGESEVEHFHLAGWRDHHVAGFDVAVNDPARVCRGECFGRLQSD